MAVAEQVAVGRPRSTPRWKRLWSNFAIIFDSRVGTIGFAIVFFWFLIAIVSLVWTPSPPNASLFDQNLPPNAVNWLGTDHLGRDLLSRLMTGAQVILIKTRLPGGLVIPGGVALWGVVGSTLVGVVLGMMGGYYGGWTDQGIMQILDALIAFPRIILFLVVIASLGQGDWVVILAITVTGAPGVARLARGLALDLKSRDYVLAAQTRGESASYVMFREILPNARGPILVDAMLRVGYAIFAIATLGFLGIGLPPPDPDWGNMVNEARSFIFVNPYAILFISLAIASLVVGLNLFADGLNEETSRYQK